MPLPGLPGRAWLVDQTDRLIALVGGRRLGPAATVDGAWSQHGAGRILRHLGGRWERLSPLDGTGEALGPCPGGRPEVVCWDDTATTWAWASRGALWRGRPDGVEQLTEGLPRGLRPALAPTGRGGWWHAAGPLGDEVVVRGPGGRVEDRWSLPGPVLQLAPTGGPEGGAIAWVLHCDHGHLIGVRPQPACALVARRVGPGRDAVAHAQGLLRLDPHGHLHALDPHLGDRSPAVGSPADLPWAERLTLDPSGTRCGAWVVTQGRLRAVSWSLS